MRNLLRLFFIPLLLWGLTIQAQTRTIKGRVNSPKGPVAGASVVLKGNLSGTSTDENGNFSLTAPAGAATLVISSVGFKETEVAVAAGKSDVAVSLSEGGGDLGEVVVTALGISRKQKNLVYATQSIKPAELTEVRDPNNVINSLQGKVVNAVINQGSGGPGSGARIVLRGNKSLQQSNNALIVVDGVPIVNGTNGTVTSDFGGVQGSDGASSINPDDIESMNVLRGASAAALYGSAAGNGVIVITTKRGKKDKTSVLVNSGIAFEKPFQLNALQNEYGQGNGGTIKVNADGESIAGESWGAKMDGQSIKAYNGETRSYSAQPDNVKDFFRTGSTFNNSIGISGGSEKLQTYLSYTNNAVQGILPRNDMNRHTFNLRLTNQISKKFSVDAKINYILQDIKSKYANGESPVSPFINIFQIPRNVSLADAKNYEIINNVGIAERAPYPVTNAALYQNPYWVVHNTENNEKRNRLMGFVSAKYDITPWLHVTGRANLDKTNDQITSSSKQGTVGVGSAGGGYGVTTIDQIQKWFDLMVDGTNKITEKLRIDYRVGAVYQDNKYDQVNNGSGGLNVANFFSFNFASNPSISVGSSQVQTQSVFGQVNLSYLDAIFLDASLRNEWDSRLPSPYSFAYPSVGLAFVLSDLMKLPDAISFLKLSGNYAEVGNGGQPQIRFNTYGYSQGAGNGYVARSATQAIEDLKPEIVKSLEFSLDAKFLKNRLGLQFTWYKSNSINQLLTIDVPPATGYGKKYINAGDIQNQGVEFVLSATPVSNRNMTWDVAFNVGINKNKIISLTDDLKSFTLGGFSRSATPFIKEGGSYGDMVGFGWLKNDKGQYVVNVDGAPLSTETRGEYVDLGNFMPKATLGLTNTFNYKGIFARILIDGRIGGVVNDGTEQLLSFIGVTKGTSEHREGGWNLGGVDASGAANTKTINAQKYWTTVSGGRYGTAEFFTYDATNFRIRELSVGYGIPLKPNLMLKSAKISLVARNLLWLYRGSATLDIPGLSKRKMSFDPDMSLGNGNWQGVNYGSFPSTRSIGLNLQLTF